MLNKEEHLLATLAEELGEVQNVIGKAQRFGMQDVSPLGDKEDNLTELIKEFSQAVAVYEMLLEHLHENNRDTEISKEMRKKRERVREYMDYAREKGKLT